MRVEQQQLKLFLLDGGLVTDKDIREAEKRVKETGQSLGAILISEGKITEDDYRRLQAYILGIPFVSLEKEKINFETLSLIPESIARTHNIVAYKKTGDVLEVAMLDPEDMQTIDFLKKDLKLSVRPRLTDTKSVKNALTQYQKSLQAEFGDIIDAESDKALKVVTDDNAGEVSSDDDLKKLAEDAPIVKIVDTLLRHAILQRGSDIHVEPMEKEVLVRYRIDGILRDAMKFPKNLAPGIIARIKVLSSLRLDEKRLPQDGRFKIETDKEKVSFRVSILPVYAGEKAVLRILHESAQGFTLESLGLEAEQVDDIQHAIKRPNGMILITGPTGSGKTTTLYTLLDILNKPSVNISTVEDPIEYQMPRINQTQVKPDIGFTFSSGLRSLVRQDPDIIMVGEIRDNETAMLAINAALTGHLVLSTLHTNSAAGAIPRLLDMRAESFLLASTLNLIVAQRLVRKLHTSKEKYTLTKEQLDDLGSDVDLDRVLQFMRVGKVIEPKMEWKDVTFYKAKKSEGAPDGYIDRIGIHEVLVVSESVRRMVTSKATTSEIEEQAKKEGMMTMIESGIIKATRGLTTIEEVLRVTRE